MTPTTPAPTTPQTPPKPRRKRPGRAVVLHCVPWEMYTKLLRVFEERPGVKLAYDCGDLEIMSPSLRHDRRDRTLARLVVALTEELGLPIVSGGGTTMRRRKIRKGIEGDELYWIANAPRMAGVESLNLKIHPPPDLALEVDVSRSSLNRLGIYASLGVPEVWRLDGDELRFYLLNANRRGYTETTISRTFPFVASADLIPFVLQGRASGDENAVVVAFRAWVRQRVASQPAAPPAPPTTP